MAAVAFAALTVPDSASAATAFAAGLHQARKRGFANAECYAKVFETHASLNPYGHWVVRARKRDNFFQLDVQTRCGISA